MQLFTDNTHSIYFTSDEHFVDLKAIEINSIDDAIGVYDVCDPMVFVDQLNLYANKHNELYTQPHRNSANTPVIFSFLENLTNAEIVEQVITTLDFKAAEEFVGKMKKVWQCRWVNVNVVVDNVETIELEGFDSSQILIEINHDQEDIVTTVISGKHGAHIHATTA